MNVVTRICSTIILLLGAVAYALSPRPALSATVDCTMGELIQPQLNMGQTFIQVIGVCPGDIFMPDDGIVIQGVVSPAGATIAGNVFINGVQRVSIQNLTIQGNTQITGGANAFFHQATLNGSTLVATNASAGFNESHFTGPGEVAVADSSMANIGSSSIQNKQGNLTVNTGSFLQLRDSTVEDLGGAFFILTGSTATVFNTTIEGTDNGIQIVRGSTALFGSSKIGPANVDDASFSCSPVCVADNSEARFHDTIIEGTNNDPGIGGAVTIFRQSSVRIRGESSVKNDGTQPAVGVFHNSSFRQDKGSSPPAEIVGGINVFGSYADLRNFHVTGDVTGDLNAVVRLRGTVAMDTSVVDGDVTLDRDSALDFGSPAPEINGDVVCIDKQQSAASGTPGGVGARKCKGF